MVLHAVKRLPKATWTNDRDAFYAPINPDNPVNPVNENSASSASPRLCVDNPIDPATGLPGEFVTDCVVWSAFAGSNNCVSLRNVQYKGKVWQIANQMYPFLLDEVRQWPCAHGDIAAQLAAANEDRFLAKWLAARENMELSNYENMRLCDYENASAGNPIIPQSHNPIAALRAAHDALRAKLLPQMYTFGFLNPDVVYFT